MKNLDMTMNETMHSGPHVSDDLYQTGRLRRSTLVGLRWMAIAGQLTALACVYFIFQFEFPVLYCLLFIGLSALFNIVIIMGAPLDRRITNFEVGTQLFFDVLQMTALLFFTGGMANPFALLLIAPVVVASKTLNKFVFGVTAITVMITSLLLLQTSLPLPWQDNANLELPRLYLYGAWLALVVGMLFTSSYTWRATAQTRRMTAALAASEQILAHEHKLTALGGLAAAAAHELGTPLATISLVAKEMALSAGKNTELKEDADLLLSQAARCRDILQGLSQRGDVGDIVHDQLDLTALIQEVTEPYINLGKDIIIEIQPPDSDIEGFSEIPVIRRAPELVYSLTNIVENAVDFALARVRIIGSWDGLSVSVNIIDDGPGFNASVLTKLGEPYISERRGREQKAGGLGLGIFIAKTMVNRIGGAVTFSNPIGGGAAVKLSWPL